MNKLRNVIRFIAALVFAPVFWCILIPFFAFLVWLMDEDIYIIKYSISGWKRWITFSKKGGQ